MQFKEALLALQANAAFKAWSAANPNNYLAHGFLMQGTQFANEWQIGFYNKSEDRIIVFTVGEDIRMNPPSELFKKDSGVLELVLADIWHDANDALAAAEEYRQEHYREHTPQQTILLVQRLKIGQLWNITFVTDTFSVCNIKLDTKDLTVKSASCESLMGWGTAVKGERKH
jgi:hypothetical protein